MILISAVWSAYKLSACQRDTLDAYAVDGVFSVRAILIEVMPF
jgi:hypothetical protein